MAEHRSLEELMGNLDNKYKIALIAAKRARLLNMGAEKKVDIKANKFYTIALYETLLNKVKYHEQKIRTK